MWKKGIKIETKVVEGEETYREVDKKKSGQKDGRTGNRTNRQVDKKKSGQKDKLTKRRTNRQVDK
jgi:hypothetical protein